MVNLANELKTKEWKYKLEKLGFSWFIAPKEKWHDYRNIDLTISVREFGENNRTENPLFDPDSKPPSKLINSWLAGVPAILGQESSYQNLRQNPLDFIEVRSKQELIQSLMEIRENKELYRKMVENGLRRAMEYSTKEVRCEWEEVIEREIYPCYEKWNRLSKYKRQYFNLINILLYLMNRKNLSDLIDGAIKEIKKRVALE